MSTEYKLTPELIELIEEKVNKCLTEIDDGLGERLSDFSLRIS